MVRGITVVVLFSFLARVANAELYTYAVFPGQVLTQGAEWKVVKWGPNNECVLKQDSGKVPFALVTPAEGACPVGSTLNLNEGRETPWKPFPVDSAAPVVHKFKGIEFSWFHDPFCHNNADALANRDRLNEALTHLAPGDTLSISGKYCVASGVAADRLSHVTIDLRGELFFSQGPDAWGHEDHGIILYGSTNLLLTSSNRKGLIRTKACTLWYIQRTIFGTAGGKKLLYLDMDRNLTFASSRIVMEHLKIHDSPGYHVYMNKAVDVIVRHMDVRVTCLSNLVPFKPALKMMAQQTDGIDIWGSNVHVHDVTVDNGDDCVCVKGGDDGSGIISENWLVENSTASGAGLTVGTLGWGHHMPVRNVTFRNIYMPNTAAGIYVKPVYNNVTDVLYQNITVHGEALLFPVMIGPVHQFDGNCPWKWPLGGGTCSLRDESGSWVIDVKIDGLKIIRRFPHIGRLMGSSDFIIMGDDRGKDRTQTRVQLSNIEVVGISPSHCDDPPASLTRVCNNGCYAAEVTTDGSYNVECTAFGTKVADGACAPMIGRVNERCPSGVAHKDRWCKGSGLRCNTSSYVV